MNQDKERLAYLDAAAAEVYRQVEENPGLGIPVNPDVAEHMGAFVEDAMDELDVLESHIGVNPDGTVAETAEAA